MSRSILTDPVCCSGVKSINRLSSIDNKVNTFKDIEWQSKCTRSGWREARGVISTPFFFTADNSNAKTRICSRRIMRKNIASSTRLEMRLCNPALTTATLSRREHKDRRCTVWKCCCVSYFEEFTLVNMPIKSCRHQDAITLRVKECRPL